MQKKSKTTKNSAPKHEEVSDVVAAPKAPESKKGGEKKKVEKKSDVKALVLKKYHLKKLIDWLTFIVRNPGTPEQVTFPFSLHGPRARVRNRVTMLIQKAYDGVETERLALCDEFGKKDEDNKPVMTETGSFEIEDREAFDKAFTELMDEDIAFDILPSTENDWNVVKNIVIADLRTDMTFHEGIIYEEVCTAFEKI